MACGNCETAARKGLKFCPNCGEQVESLREEPVQIEPTAVPAGRKMSRKKRGGIIALLLAIALGGAYYGLSSQVFTAEANADEIREAIQLSDAKTLAEHVEYDGETVDEKRAKRFLDALKEAPEEKEGLLDYLRLAGRSLGAENDGDIPARLVASGRQYGIFTDYRLRLEAMEATVVSNFKGTKLTLVDPVGTEKSKAGGDGIVLQGVYPGLLKAKVDYDGQYGKESAEVTINPLTLDPSERTYEVTLKGNAVELDQTYPDATLIVDGKDTGRTLEDLKEYGPIPKQGVKLSIENYFDWGTETSKQVLVKPDMKEVTFAFMPSEATLDQIEGAVARHASDWVDAAENRSTDYFSLVDDGAYLAKQQSNYDDWYDRDREWRGEYLSSSIDASSAKFVEYGGGIAVEVTATTRIRGKFVDYYDGEDLTNESTSTSVFEYLFTYGEDDDMESSFRIQQATNIK